MKIAVVIPSFYPATVYGGPIFSSYQLAIELARLGHEIEVLTTDANGKTRLRNLEKNSFIILKENLKVKYYYEEFTKFLSFSLIFNLWRDLRTADLVHIQGIFSYPTPFALIYSKLLKKKIILSPRGTFLNWAINHRRGRKKIWLLLFVTPFIKGITWHATSIEEADSIHKRFPKSIVKIAVDGVYIDNYKHSNYLSKKLYVQKYAGIENNAEKIIISMGRLHKVKGFDILIHAFKSVHQAFSNSYLLIAGEDEGELDNLIKLRDELGLNNFVFFTGKISDQNKIDFFANADVFALPSHNENFGIVYAEALAAGTPIVASNHTPWQMIENEKCGYCVENSSDKFAGAIISLLNQDREQLRVNSAKFGGNYDWKIVAEQFQTILMSINTTV